MAKPPVGRIALTPQGEVAQSDGRVGSQEDFARVVYLLQGGHGFFHQHFQVLGGEIVHEPDGGFARSGVIMMPP